MSIRPTRLAATTLTLALLLSGCSISQLPTGPGGKSGGTTTGGTGATGGTGGTGGTSIGTSGEGPVHNLPLEALNGVEFKPITADTSRYIANNGGNIVAAGAGNVVSGNGAAGVATKAAAAPSAAAAPMVADRAAGGASSGALIANDGGGTVGTTPPSDNAGGGAYSGNVWSYYGYNGYFGGYGDQQMALVSLQQAELPGNKGSFAEIISGTCAPIVKAWSADARLISSNAQIDNNGSLLAPNVPQANGKVAIDAAIYGGYGDPSGWNLTYVSNKRTEVLSFTVTAAKTTVIRMRWEPLNLDPARVTTDSATAVKKIIDAIKTKTFKSQEETTGKDYFLGFPFDQPKTGQWDGDYQRTEVVYDVPGTARWSVNLQEIMGKLVWQLNFYDYNNGYGGGVVYANAGVAVAAPVRGLEGVDDTKPVPVPACTPSAVEQPGWFNNSAQGMVDAENGTVIRFSRPTRTFYKNGPDTGCAVPTTTALPPDAGTAVSPTIK